MKRILLLLLFTAIAVSYGNSQTIVKLLLPANCNSTTTSADELKKDNKSEVGLYPNPNNGSFSLDVCFKRKIDNATICISNTMGQIVFSETVFCDSERFVKRLHLQGIPKGLYFLSITNDNQEAKTKLQIK